MLLADHPDDRPLQIIGAQMLDLEDALASVQPRPRPQALAAAADLFGCDARVRQGVLQALDHGVTEVTLWGENWPSELDDSVGLVQHRLSMAAQTFKAQALAAAAAPHAPIGHDRDLPQRAAGLAVGRRGPGPRQLAGADSAAADGAFVARLTCGRVPSLTTTTRVEM